MGSFDGVRKENDSQAGPGDGGLIRDASSTASSRRRFLASGLALGAVGAGSMLWPSQAVASAESARGRRLSRRSSNFLLPESFGADVNAVDNSGPLQAALEASAAQATPLLMNQTYDTRMPLYLPSFAQWIGQGKIRNTNDGTNDNHKIALLAGNYHPAHWDNLAYYSGGPVSASDTSVVLDTPSEAGNFDCGDLVFCRSVEYWLGNPGVTHPIYGSFNRVVCSDSSTGVITLEFPWLRDVANTEIAHANNNIRDQQNLRDLYCCYGAVVDGISVQSVEGNAITRGGTLNCDLHYGELRGLTGVFGNAFTFTTLQVDSIVCDRKILDVAACSVGSTISVGSALYEKSGRSTSSGLITHNESSYDNTISFGTVTADFDFPGQNLIRIGVASGTTMTINSFDATEAAGNVVAFVNDLRPDPAETQSATRDNSVSIGTFTGGSNLLRFVTYGNAGGELERCDVDGSFSGTANSAAIDCSGSGHTIRGHYSSGAVDLGDGMHMDIDVTGTSGVVGCTGTASNVVKVNGVSMSC
jgi:hypothetical protein